MRRGRSHPALPRGPGTLCLCLCLVACASAPQGVLVERIGGTERVRGFASPTAYEAYLRAEIAASRGDIPGATRHLELAELADPDEGYLPARRAEVLLRAGDLDGAATAATEAVEAHPDAGAAWIALAEVRSRQGDIPGAQTAAGRALALDPDDPDVRAAVAAVAGGSPSDVARARDGAPGSTTADHAASWGATLAPDGAPRRSTRARARAEAQVFWSRGQWSLVDRVLSPLVALDPGDLTDRVRLIEARARDGRPGDAARLVPGVPVADGHAATGTPGATGTVTQPLVPAGVTAAAHARMWLLGGRVDLAREEAARALATDAADAPAALVLGEALLVSGERARGLGVLGAIAPGTEHYAAARVVAAGALALAGLSDAADAVLAQAVPGASDADGRDRLRVARGRGLFSRGVTLAVEGRAVLAEVETPWGHHQRAELEASLEAPGLVLTDLRARTGIAYEDALADAWVVLVCRLHPGACAPQDAAAALVRARQGAPMAAVTLRAEAAMASDPREAAGGVRRAVSLEPLSPAAGVRPRSLGAGEHTRTP